MKLSAFFPLPTHISLAVRMEAYPECSKLVQRKITLTLLTHIFWKVYFVYITARLF